MIDNQTENVNPSFSEAVQKGLISIDEQTYHQPEEEQYYMVQDALNRDHVLADTEKFNVSGGAKKATLTIITKSFLPSNGAASTTVMKQAREQPQQKSTIKILKKMQKKVISLSDALHMGLINEETYELLENNVTFAHNPDSFLKSKKYKVKDPQSGLNLTLEEAIEREILNPNDITKFHIPFCRSLTIPQLIERDLLDMESQMIIHPETGDLLTLNEAIACDIVDKYSLIRNDKKHKITLKEALKMGYIDGHARIVIKSKKGDLNIKSAIEKGLFDVEKSPSKEKVTDVSKNIPLIGQTFPIIIKRRLFILETREVIHIISGKKIPLKYAIESDYIMSVPCVPNAYEIFIPDAIDQNLIDIDFDTFTCPQTGEIMTLQDAYSHGYLYAKPLHAIISHESLNSTTITKEVKNISHTVKTKSIDILDGFTMTSANEVMNNKTGELFTLQQAKDQGMAIERNEVNQFTTKEFENLHEGELSRSPVESEFTKTSDLSTRFDNKEDQEMEVSQLEEKHIKTIKKITIIREIKYDENGKEIITESVDNEPEIFESSMPTADKEFDEMFKKFKQENPDFEQEEIVTQTVNNETTITKVIKEYNITREETEITKSDDIEEGVEAYEFEEYVPPTVKEVSPGPKESLI